MAKPSVASGCIIKLLNYNANSFAMTFLYCMTPNFYQGNISYHDCAEESYHLWGNSWMTQFGDVLTGGYFWRPAHQPRRLCVLVWLCCTEPGLLQAIQPLRLSPMDHIGPEREALRGAAICQRPAAVSLSLQQGP